MAREMKYEDARKRLDEILAALENGETTIDDLQTLALEAKSLLKYCEHKLRTVQKDINLVEEE